MTSYKQVKYDFSGRSVLITGCASGIGLAAAFRFFECGAQLVLADVNQDMGVSLRDKICSSGGKAIFLQTDVSNIDDCELLVSSALSEYGALDVAFNNAGIVGNLSLTADCHEDNWQSLLDVNLTGVFNCMKYEINAMLDVGGGVIINNASVMGLGGGVNASAYSAAKHGVVGLTRSAAKEYGRKGIRINAICPGFVETPMTQVGGAFADKVITKVVRRTAMGRLAQPGEIVEPVLWLSSDAASYVTGSIIPVDGGYTA